MQVCIYFLSSFRNLTCTTRMAMWRLWLLIAGLNIIRSGVCVNGVHVSKLYHGTMTWIQKVGNVHVLLMPRIPKILCLFKTFAWFQNMMACSLATVLVIQRCARWPWPICEGVWQTKLNQSSAYVLVTSYSPWLLVPILIKWSKRLNWYSDKLYRAVCKHFELDCI